MSGLANVPPRCGGARRHHRLYARGAGGASRSYGLQVAALAGVPKSVIHQAATSWRAGSATPVAAGESRPAPVAMAPQSHPIVDELEAVRPDELTPRQALDLLYRLKQML